MNTPVIKNEAAQFYAMLALIKCASEFKDYLINCKAVGGTVKHEMKLAFNQFNKFHDRITKDMPAAEREAWDKEWNRDYLAFSSIFEKMADMNDEQRTTMETFAYELHKGNVIIEYKD